jgi:hypothetical protein
MEEKFLLCRRLYRELKSSPLPIGEQALAQREQKLAVYRRLYQTLKAQLPVDWVDRELPPPPRMLTPRERVIAAVAGQPDLFEFVIPQPNGFLVHKNAKVIYELFSLQQSDTGLTSEREYVVLSAAYYEAILTALADSIKQQLACS